MGAIKLEQNNKELKTCPFCAEDILQNALKCKHCGEHLGVNSKNNDIPKVTLIVASINAIYSLLYGITLQYQHLLGDVGSTLTQLYRRFPGLEVSNLIFGSIGVLALLWFSTTVIMSWKRIEGGLHQLILSSKGIIAFTVLHSLVNVTVLINSSKWSLLSSQEAGSLIGGIIGGAVGGTVVYGAIIYFIGKFNKNQEGL